MPIRTLVVDDTVIYRKIASDVVDSFPEVKLVGTAPNGELALKKIAQNPVDLVLCDVHMPGMDGVETLIEIKKEFPKTFVVMMSGISSRSADITIKALEMGAIDFIQKPTGRTPEENFKQLKNDFKTVLRHVQIRINTSTVLGKTLPQKPQRKTTAVTQTTQLPKSFPKTSPLTYGILAIGVSTGGPEALNRLIPSLPKNLPVPLVMVQHMPPKFTQSLADSLNRKSQVNVVEASEGETLYPGTVYIAPGGKHMTVREHDDKIIVGINDGPPENSCKPAVDVLFRSVAATYGKKGILAIILTGMGSDGEKGIRTIKRKGSYCITQSEQSCVVYGMPRAVDLAGLSNISLPIDEIKNEICKKLRC